MSDQVEQAFLQGGRVYDVEIPRSVLEAALEEKQNGSGIVLPGLSLDSLSPENQQLFEARVIGGMFTRVALGSYAVKEIGESSESFFDLDDATRTEFRKELGELYADTALESLSRTNSEVVDLLGATEAAEQAHPLPFIPHSFVRHHIAQTKRRELTRGDRLSRIRAYANVLPGTFPPDGFTDRTVGTNDSVLVQAFGRNSIPDKALPEVARRHEVSGSDIAVFEQLHAEGFDAGEANKALAKMVMRRELKGSAVIEPVMQWEVAYAMWELDSALYETYAQYIHTVWPASGFYPTYEVKADSIQTMDTLGLYNPKELSHQDMMVRALGILARQGVEADALVGHIPFDPKSVQAQARGPGQWTVRETLTRVEHVLRGRVQF